MRGARWKALRAWTSTRCVRTLSARLLQGFGNVGAWAAEILADMGGKVLAVSDAWGAVQNPEGLDVKELRRHLAAGGKLADFPGGVAIIFLVLASAKQHVLHKKRTADL